jgi:hypothetical protein
LPTVHRTLLRLGLLAGEAQKLVWGLHVQSYEHELLWPPSESRDDRPGAQTLFAGLTRHLDGKLRRLSMMAIEFKALARELVENLRPREAYPRRVGAPGTDLPVKNLKAQLEDYERELVRSALQACNMNQVLAARLLRVLPTTLNEKMKRLGLRNQRPRRGVHRHGAIMGR